MELDEIATKLGEALREGLVLETERLFKKRPPPEMHVDFGPGASETRYGLITNGPPEAVVINKSFRIFNINAVRKKILHLTLHRHWFDLIARGEKTTEHRRVKPYWAKRLVGKHYDEIWFRNGYTEDRPFMRVEFLRMERQRVRIYGEVYTIHLGRVLEIRNWHDIQQNR